MQKIVTHLWFDDQAEAAARYYVGIFKQSKLGEIAYFPPVGQEIHHRPAGSVMTVAFELQGQMFLALNGGPVFTFNEAVSLMVQCDTQDEIDYYWSRLGEGGDQAAQQCGWLKDKYGLSWQIVPAAMNALMADKERATRVMAAMLKMKKLDLAQLEAA